MTVKLDSGPTYSVGSTTESNYLDYDINFAFARLYAKIYSIIKNAASYIYILEDDAIEISNINFDLSACEEDEIDPFTTVDFFIHHKSLIEPLQIKIDLDLKMNDDFNIGYVARAITDKEDERWD